MNTVNKSKNIPVTIGSVITYIYCIFNLLIIILIHFPWDVIDFLAAPLLIVDGYTWHIYGIISICTFFSKLSMSFKDKQNSSLKKAAVLHLIAMVISFISIVYIFSVCFV